MPTQKGSVKLFRLLGIDVYLHWAWFVAFLFFSTRPHEYPNYGWNALEILGLFVIVLTHEFGHALACRSVGGTANLIVLWPLGGVAYVNPPQRPGAQLWSIAAGPLVNVALAPVLLGLFYLGKSQGWNTEFPNAFMLLKNITIINIALLIFNCIPVYPLDGGQMLRSLLWFLFGKANSLLAASIIGFIGVGGLGLLALFLGNIWLGVVAAFILMNWPRSPRSHAEGALPVHPAKPRRRSVRSGAAASAGTNSTPSPALRLVRTAARTTP
jgi:Zn-dependent protease